jgi:hypothetical protein
VRRRQRELLTEMRDDIRALGSALDAVARDQALSVERRASMQRVADTITARLDSLEKAMLDLQRWRDEAAGAIRLARRRFNAKGRPGLGTSCGITHVAAGPRHDSGLAFARRGTADTVAGSATDAL